MAGYAGTFERTISGVATYMDGVQLKIGDRFKPTQRITLPINYLERNTHDDLSRFEYDFELEKEVLQKAEERRLQEEQNNMKSLQVTTDTKVKQTKDDTVVHSTLNLPNGTLHTGVNQVTNGYIQEQGLLVQPKPAMLSMDILTPTPLANPGVTKKAIDQKPLIDLADFESSATDPFEMTELKTLNDMEELRSVLEQTLPTSSSETFSNDANSQLAHERPVVGQTSNGKSEMTMDPPVENKIDSIPFPLDPNQNQLETSPRFTSPLEINTSEDLDGGMMTYTTTSTLQNTLMSNTPQQTFNSPMYICKDDSFSRKTPLPPISPKRPTSNDFKDQGVEGDLAKFELNRTGTDLSITSNISSTSCVAGSLLGEIEVPPSYPKNLNKYPCLPDRPAVRAASPDPEQHAMFTTLDKEKQHFTRSIAGMGFPLLRVAKVVDRNGCDMDIVVETLCAIERLCDKGFHETKSEDILHLVDNDETKAFEFLRLIKQFETLGFETEDIKKQLVIVGTDEEKVLNALTKTS